MTPFVIFICRDFNLDAFSGAAGMFSVEWSIFYLTPVALGSVAEQSSDLVLHS